MLLTRIISSFTDNWSFFTIKVVMELMRGIRSQLTTISGPGAQDFFPMMSLSHCRPDTSLKLFPVKVNLLPSIQRA